MTTFNAGAEAYDHYMGAWSRLLAPRFADFAGIVRPPSSVRGVASQELGEPHRRPRPRGTHAPTQDRKLPPTRVLDVGCGTGALTADLMSRLGPGAVAAVDPSPAFVEATRARNPGVEVQQASAEALPFADGSVDAALAQLVVHFMPDPVAGLREMRRVTRPAGVVAACVWDYAGGRGPLGPFWDAVLTLDPTAEGESDLPGAREGHLMSLLIDAGLSDVDETALTVRREFGSFEDWWEPFTLGVGPGGVYVARATEAHVVAIREACRSMLPAGQPFTLSASAWAARGRAT